MANRALHLPITWLGFRWDPQELYLSGADGRQWAIEPVAALETGAFELDTTTPDRRDALRRYAESLRDGAPAAWPRIDGQPEAGEVAHA